VKSKTTKTTSSAGKIFKDILARSPLEGSFLIACPDLIRCRRAEQSLVAAFIKQSGVKVDPQSITQTIQANELKEDTIVRLKDSTANLSLFSNISILVFRDVDVIKAQTADSFIDFLSKPTPQTLIICTARSMPQISKVLKFFRANNAAILIDEPTRLEATKWIEREAKTCGLDLSTQIIEALYELAEGEHLVTETPTMDNLHRLIDRLKLYCDEGAAPTASDLNDLFDKSHAANEFEFIDALLSGNIAQAEVLLSMVLNQGQNPFLLLSLVSRSFTNALLIGRMAEKGFSDNDIQSALKMNPWVFRKTAPKAKRLKLEKVLSALKTVAIIDNRFKSSSLEEEQLFSKLIQMA